MSAKNANAPSRMADARAGAAVSSTISLTLVISGIANVGSIACQADAIGARNVSSDALARINIDALAARSGEFFVNKKYMVGTGGSPTPLIWTVGTTPTIGPPPSFAPRTISLPKAP